MQISNSLSSSKLCQSHITSLCTRRHLCLQARLQQSIQIVAIRLAHINGVEWKEVVLLCHSLLHDKELEIAQFGIMQQALAQFLFTTSPSSTQACKDDIENWH